MSVFVAALVIVGVLLAWASGYLAGQARTWGKVGRMLDEEEP